MEMKSFHQSFFDESFLKVKYHRNCKIPLCKKKTKINLFDSKHGAYKGCLFETRGITPGVGTPILCGL